MSHNPNSFGHVIGRLTQDPVVFPNAASGKTTVKFTVAAKRNYRSKSTNQVESDFLPMTVFLNAGQKLEDTPYGNLAAGNLYAFDYTPRSSQYDDKNGERVYSTDFVVDSMSFLEPKSVTDARRASKSQSEQNQQAQAAPAAQAQTPAAAPQAQPQAQAPVAQPQAAPAQTPWGQPMDTPAPGFAQE